MREPNPHISGEIQPVWLTLDQFARSLGLRPQSRSARNWHARGGADFPLSVRLPNGQIRIHIDDYLRWMNRRSSDPLPQCARSKRNKQHPDEMSMAELAAYLQVGLSSLYKWEKRGGSTALPPVMRDLPERTRRWKKKTVDQWIRKHYLSTSGF